jgi:hypothetical protein
MPKIPDDMSAAAVERRAKMTERMRAAEAKKTTVDANPKPPKPRIAKGR